jgi:hypothetical protein
VPHCVLALALSSPLSRQGQHLWVAFSPRRFGAPVPSPSLPHCGCPCADSSAWSEFSCGAS